MAEATHQLQRRATLATRAAASATTAKAHLEQALLHASHARADGAGTDLASAIATVLRAITRAEAHRRRLLRKLDREEATHG